MQVSMQKDRVFAGRLRTAGYRATSGRIELLRALANAKEPLTVEEVAEAVRGKIDIANAYRALESFSKSGLVRKVDLHHQHAHYELSNPGVHHHHIVCESCGKIEDIHLPESELEKEALKKSDFASIRSHALEFFGECKSCAKAI